MLVAKTMTASAPAAWALLADTAHWPSWGPTVSAVEPPSGLVAPGLEGRVRTPVGAWLPFRITDVDPGRRWSWKVAGVQATSHRVDDLGDGRIRVGFELPLVAAAYGVVCWVALRRIERMLGDASSAGGTGSRDGMADRDIIEHLTDEHRQVDEMWSQLQALHTQGSDQQAELARKIVKALSTHDAIELQLLYPALKRAGGEELAEHGKDEHARIRHLLAEVDGKDPSDPAIYGKLDEAIRLVKAHVAEEEGQMFPKLRSSMDRKELIDLGKLSETAEAVAPTHPHTTTPDGAIGATVVGAAAGMVDKVRDAIKGEK